MPPSRQVRPLIHDGRPENILVRGRVVRGNVEEAIATADVLAEAEYETGFVEHAYIEPEAGFARCTGDQIEIQACTQAPYMDRSDIAAILGIEPEKVRIIPTAVGGGFGSKLDLSVQPFLAIAAWHLKRPVRMVYSRAESIVSTTKRHPSRIHLRGGCTKDGKLLALDFAPLVESPTDPIINTGYQIIADGGTPAGEAAAAAESGRTVKSAMSSTSSSAFGCTLAARVPSSP